MTRSRSRQTTRIPTQVTACTCASLRKAARVVTQSYDAALQPAGLKTTQFTLLATLANAGDLPLTRLAEALVMDRTTLTRNLKPLLGQGLVAVGSERDQRVRKIKLTPKGRAIFKDALVHWEAVQSKLVAGLGVTRWARFLDDLAATVAAARRG